MIGRDTVGVVEATLVSWALFAGACGPAAREADRTPGAAAAAIEPRIVVMAPWAAEILPAIGAGDLVVGIGDYVTWPPELADLPRVGSFDRPNAERILGLGADLFVTTASRAGEDAHDQLERLGVEVLALDTSTHEGVLAAIEQLGDRLGREEEARRLGLRIRTGMAEVAARASGARRRRVLLVVGREPLYVAGPGSHLDWLIEIAGGINFAADSRSPYQLLSLETALERLPEVIIDTSDNRPGALSGRLAGPWGRWPFLPAVAEDRVYWVDPSRLTVAGPRLPEMAELMGRMIHPEVFGGVGEGELARLAGATRSPPEGTQ